MARRRRIDQSYLKSAIFGFEDGLVSTTGIVAGLSAGAHDPHIIVLGALVNIGVEAVSMGAGEFISERGIHSLRGNRHTDSASLSGVVMGASFMVAGLIPLLPVLVLPYPHSIVISLAAALAAMFGLGLVRTKAVGSSNYWRSAVETLAIGGTATLIGFLVGLLVKM